MIVHIAENQVRRVVMGYAEGAPTAAQQAKMASMGPGGGMGRGGGMGGPPGGMRRGG